MTTTFLRTLLLACTLYIIGIPTAQAQDPDTAALPEAEALPWPQCLTAALDTLITHEEMLAFSQLGLYVYDLTADSALYDHGRMQLLRPASVQKLFTTSTALTYLGGGFQFVTRMYVNGEVQDSTLYGDIYMKGGFDPCFSYEDMSAFVDTLRLHGIRAIEGRVFSDMSLKDTLKWGEGWSWDDDERTLRPLLYDGRDVFLSRFYEMLDEAAIGHPADFSEKLVPLDSVRQMAVRSHTVDQILMRLLKNSNNLYAEALFYQLGAAEGQKYPSARLSAAKVAELERSIGMNPDEYSVADGSGLSPYNYVTAELVVTLLRYIWQHNDVYLHLYPALPIAGEDGTLERRMRGTSAEGNVHAKTGTLRKVSTLAGYATAPNEHFLCFAILNQGIRSQAVAHRFQDDVCRILTGSW